MQATPHAIRDLSRILTFRSPHYVKIISQPEEFAVMNTPESYPGYSSSQALARSAKNFPDHSALNYMGRIISYKKLEAMVNAFSRALTNMGIKPGDFVSSVPQKAAVPICKKGDV